VAQRCPQSTRFDTPRFHDPSPILLIVTTRPMVVQKNAVRPPDIQFPLVPNTWIPSRAPLGRFSSIVRHVHNVARESVVLVLSTRMSPTRRLSFLIDSFIWIVVSFDLACPATPFGGGRIDRREPTRTGWPFPQRMWACPPKPPEIGTVAEFHFLRFSGRVAAPYFCFGPSCGRDPADQA